MDTWAWVGTAYRDLVDAEQHRLAEALRELPGHAVSGRHQQVDALVPEVLAQARAAGLPWVEVFVRHWHLQSRVLQRYEGEKALPETVALLEFAHRAETADCPQSVCAVQDFAVCHGITDGPGYVAERLAITAETLERIDPSWSCYRCLTSEHADALLDDGQAEQALAYLVARDAEVAKEGASLEANQLADRARALTELGRLAEALTLCQNGLGLAREDSDRVSLASLRALLLARLGRSAEALAALEELAAAGEQDRFARNWVPQARTVELLVAAEAVPNDAQLGRLLTDRAHRLDEAGAHRPCADLTVVAARLAVARGARFVAGQLLALAERKLARLRVTAGIGEEVAAARAELERLEPVALPAATSPELLDHCQRHQVEVEHGIDLLEAGYATLAEPEALVHPLAGLRGALGFPRAAAELLWTAAEQAPAGPDRQAAVAHLLESLLQAGDEAGVERLAAQQAGVDQVAHHFALGRLHAARQRWSEAAAEYAAAVAVDDSLVNTRLHWAEAALAQRDYATAQRCLTETLARLDAEDEQQLTGVRWELVVAATGNGDWAVVRSTCAALGLELEPGQGPVDENWELVRVRFTEGNGTELYRVAVRTGPATARLVSVAGPEQPHNFGDSVLVRPSPLEPFPEDPTEQEGFVPSFPVVHPLTAAGFRSWFLDGCYPGEEAWGEFRQALRDQGWGLWVHSGPEYRLRDPESSAPDGSLPAVYAALAVPADAPPAAVDAELRQLTKGWRHPLVWPQLAERAGVDPAVVEEITTRYGITP